MNHLMNMGRAGIASILILVLVGCAALEVDVDVYKGPLANQRDVQAAELAVLPIAVKPMLDQIHGSLLAAKEGERTVGTSPFDDVDAENVASSIDYALDVVEDVLSLYYDNYDPRNTTRGSSVPGGRSTSGTTFGQADRRLGKHKPFPDLQRTDLGSGASVRGLYSIYYGVQQHGEDEGSLERYVAEPYYSRVGLAPRDLRTLTDFAERLLVVTRLDVLFIPPDRGFDLFVDLRGDYVKRRDRYVQLLEAIGNTILSQLDAFTRLVEHEAHMRAPVAKDIIQGEAKAMLGNNSLGNYVDRRDVLQQTIAELQRQYIDALKSTSGKTQEEYDAQVAGLEAAIEAAYSYRATMTQMLPASTFLRNSYPSSALQVGDSNLEDNMLDGMYYRQIPVLGSILPNRRQEELRKIQREIDKRYWQNVNHVRLRGGGATNFVVTKDDVGNWYVKGFSANPNKIFQSALGLLMFAGGGSVSPASVLAAQKAMEGDDAAYSRIIEGAGSTAVGTQLSGAFSIEQQRFLSASSANLAAIQGDRAALATRVQSSLLSSQPKYATALNAMITAVPVPNASSTGTADQQVIDNLQDLANYRDSVKQTMTSARLLQTLQNLVSNATTTEDKAQWTGLVTEVQGLSDQGASVVAAAADAVSGEVNLIITQRGQAQRTAADSYMNALRVLIQTASVPPGE